MTLSTTRFSGGVLPYESTEQLAELRKVHVDTHVVVRRGHEVACVPLASDGVNIGNERTFEVENSSKHRTQGVGTRARSFRDQSRLLVQRFDPATFVVRQPQRDLLARATSDSSGQLVDWLHVYPKYALGARVLIRKTDLRFSAFK